MQTTYKYPFIQTAMYLSNIVGILCFLIGITQGETLFILLAILLPAGFRFFCVLTKLIEVKP